MPEKPELVKAVRAAATERDGRLTLTCSQAFTLAEQFDVKPRAIGNICNEQKIKLCACQLGCF